jgi:hypothetical protein
MKTIADLMTRSAGHAGKRVKTGGDFKVVNDVVQ